MIASESLSEFKDGAILVTCLLLHHQNSMVFLALVRWVSDNAVTRLQGDCCLKELTVIVNLFVVSTILEIIVDNIILLISSNIYHQILENL